MIKILLLLFISFCLTSCVHYNDLHESCYVTSMGVEYDLDNNLYILYLYLINNLNLTTTEQGGTEATQFGYCIKASGKSLPEAMKSIRANLNIRIDFAHLQSLIITENFFDDNRPYELITLIKNSYNFYARFSIFIAGSPIEEIFKVGNINESSAYYTLLTYAQNDVLDIEIHFLDLVNDLLIPSKTISYPIISANDKHLTGGKDNETNPIVTLEITGLSYILPSGKLSSYRFDQHDSIILSIDSSNFEWSFPYNDVIVEDYNITTKYRNDYFLIKINTTVNILTNFQQLTYSEILANIEMNITNKLIDIYELLKNDQIDLFNIDYALHIRNQLSDVLNFQTIPIKFEYNINIYSIK